jgi:hypothetical protein
LKTFGNAQTHFHDDYEEIVKRPFLIRMTGIDRAHFANSIFKVIPLSGQQGFSPPGGYEQMDTEFFYTHKVGDQKDIRPTHTK